MRVSGRRADASALRVAIDDIKIRLRESAGRSPRTPLCRSRQPSRKPTCFGSGCRPGDRRLPLTAVGFRRVRMALHLPTDGQFREGRLAPGPGRPPEPYTTFSPSDMRWLGRWLEWLRRRLQTLEETQIRACATSPGELKPRCRPSARAPICSKRSSRTAHAGTDQDRAVLPGNSPTPAENLIEGPAPAPAGDVPCRADQSFERLRLDQLIEQVVNTYRLIAAEQHVLFDEARRPKSWRDAKN